MSKQSKRQMGGSGEALPAGAVGEVKFTAEGFSGLGTNPANYGAATTLTPGVWLVILCGSFQGVPPTDMFISLADASNVLVPGDSFGMPTTADAGNSSGGGVLKATFILRVTSTTTYKTYITATQTSNATNTAYFEAIRIA